jgi:hypothetical protein
VTSDQLGYAEFDSVYALGMDSKGILYAAGFYGGTWLVRISRDHGETWKMVDTLEPAPDYYLQATALWIDSSDRVYVAGSGKQGSHLIRSSDDQGKTWTTHSLPEGTRLFGFPKLAGTRDGVLYSADSARDGAWVVYQSRDQGKSWRLVDRYLPSGAALCLPNSLDFDSRGSVFVAGQCGEDIERPMTTWLRSSDDQGESWKSLKRVDHTLSWERNNPRVTVDSQDRVFLAANPWIYERGECHWMIHRSEDWGISWTTADYLDNSGERESCSYAEATVADARAGLVVFGRGRSSVLGRVSADGGASWKEIPGLQDGLMDGPYLFIVQAVLINALGETLVGGQVLNFEGEPSWVIRKYRPD